MKAIFNTKIVHDIDKNGEEVEILDKKKEQYLIRFKDGTEIWAYSSELDFGY